MLNMLKALQSPFQLCSKEDDKTEFGLEVSHLKSLRL